MFPSRRDLVPAAADGDALEGRIFKKHKHSLFVKSRNCKLVLSLEQRVEHRSHCSAHCLCYSHGRTLISAWQRWEVMCDIYIYFMSLPLNSEDPITWVRYHVLNFNTENVLFKCSLEKNYCFGTFTRRLPYFVCLKIWV